MGERTLAAKSETMPMMMTFGVYTAERSPALTRRFASTAPVRAPMTSKGRKNPPGAPQP